MSPSVSLSLRLDYGCEVTSCLQLLLCLVSTRTTVLSHKPKQTPPSLSRFLRYFATVTGKETNAKNLCKVGPMARCDISGCLRLAGPSLTLRGTSHLGVNLLDSHNHTKLPQSRRPVTPCLENLKNEWTTEGGF